jgi:crossover junction endodeoxyribonuclease RuvC
MRILGIDCGTERTGWGVIDSDGRRHQVVAHGVIRTKTAHPLELRLCTIASGLRAVLADHQPDAAAVEGIFHAVNVKTALKLAHARGVALLAIAEAGVSLGEYSPLEIKSSLVGYGRAEKSQVQLMVRTLTGVQGDFETEDASDAVAVAICHATQVSRPASLVLSRLSLSKVAR